MNSCPIFLTAQFFGTEFRCLTRLYSQEQKIARFGDLAILKLRRWIAFYADGEFLFIIVAFLHELLPPSIPLKYCKMGNFCKSSILGTKRQKRILKSHRNNKGVSKDCQGYKLWAKSSLRFWPGVNSNGCFAMSSTVSTRTGYCSPIKCPPSFVSTSLALNI